MLDNSYKNKENAIEEVVYGFLNKCEFEELSKDVFELSIMIGMMPKGINLPKEDKSYIFQIIEKRVEHCFSFKFIDERAILLLSICAETAGKAILYLWYIQCWCFKKNVKEVDMEILGLEIFPRGIFSEKDLKTVWELQKIEKKGMESDNLIDYNFAGSSIQFLN
jgi:hypothetical protein